MAAASIKVILPANRNKLGEITLVDALSGLTAWGPTMCYGRADLSTAGAQGNSGADQTKPYGHTPTGGYIVTGRRAVSVPERAKYGAQDALRVDGVTGNAMIRKANGTHDLLIHGGRPTLGGTLLRPTNGCLRLLDVDLQALLTALTALGASFPLNMAIAEGDPGQDVAGGPDEGYEDTAHA